jgi:hypothetical protein
MSRISLALMTTLFLLSGALIAQQINSQDIHFFLYEYTGGDSNKVAIIFEVASDSAVASPGPEFSEVTASELHQKGYETPSESEESADVIESAEDAGKGYRWGSWNK